MFQYLVSLIISFQWIFQPEEASSEEHKKALSGSNAEENVFKKIKDTFENQKVQDTVVITGWKVKGLDRRVIGESDFLIVSLPLEAIIHIEVKRSQKGSQKVETRKKNNDPTIKAAEQLERTKLHLLENLPFPTGENWTYVKFLYFEIPVEEEMSKLCSSCKPHILNKGTDIVHWWSQITTTLAKEQRHTESAKSVQTYFKMVKYLLHQMFIQEDVISSG